MPTSSSHQHSKPLTSRGALVFAGRQYGPGFSLTTGAHMLPHYTPGAARRRQQIRNEAVLLRAAESLAEKVRPYAADALLSHAAQCAGKLCGGEPCVLAGGRNPIPKTLGAGA